MATLLTLYRMPALPYRPPASPNAVRLRVAGALLVIAPLFAALAAERLPAWLGLWYAGAGAVSFGAYGLDKLAAMRGAWRIAEARLHGLDLLGGIVGGLLGQALFRHKLAKPDFGRTTTVIAALHLAGLGALALGLVAWP